MQTREDASIADLYAAHAGELYGFAYRALGDRGLAEEATQETFVRAWRHTAQFDPEKGSVRAWLFGIARHVVIDMHRKRSVRPVLSTEDQREIPVGDASLDQVLLCWQVEEALRRISSDQRHALMEVYYRDRSCKEVAAELNIPEGTLKSRVYYGLKAMRRVLEELGWTDET